MPDNLAQELALLPRLGVADLRRRYTELFGETTRTGNKAWLVKRLAWRLQALAEGDLSERARRRAAELANDADLRLVPPRPTIPALFVGGRLTSRPRSERRDVGQRGRSKRGRVIAPA